MKTKRIVSINIADAYGSVKVSFTRSFATPYYGQSKITHHPTHTSYVRLLRTMLALQELGQ